MSIQVVHYQANFDGIRIALVKHLLDLLRPILPGAALSYRNMTSASQWLHFHENLCHPIPDILIVYPFWLARLAGDRFSNFADQLFTGLVHAHHWISRIIWKMADLQYILHCRYECCVSFWRNFPVVTEVRLKFIFFKILCTVMCETEGARFSSTALSASNLTVHRPRPSGASEHTKAINLASKEPSKVTSRGSFSLSLRVNAPSSPSPTNRFFKCSIVRDATAATVQPGPLGHGITQQ